MLEWAARFDLPYWWDDAVCRSDPNAHQMLFSSSERKQKDAIAKYCTSCTVKQPCLEAAMITPVSWDFGVWGGLSETDRKELRAKKT